MDKEKLNKWLTRLFAFALFIFILTFSIGLPIYFRPFYYLHINALDLPARYNSECTYEMVKDAYDEILDYLTLPGKEFGTGEFPHSPEGASHFADVKGLFTLNTVALISSAIIAFSTFKSSKTTSKIVKNLGSPNLYVKSMQVTPAGIGRPQSAIII